MGDDVLQGYAAAAVDIVERFEQISSVLLYKPVADLLPSWPSRILDVGAGTGRDAAWLAGEGHDVVAVEPVDELRDAGIALHKSRNIEWLKDRLPHLASLRNRKRSFDCVLLSAVWQHLEYDERPVAMSSLGDLAVSGGTLIMSLRYGPGDPSRAVYEPRIEATIETALLAGFELIRKRNADSIQLSNRAVGVHWTWLAFRVV
jgi:SAM-dependent methyltransferase